jgi:hypothetical protein
VARLSAIGTQHYLQAGVKKEGRGSSMIKVKSPKLNVAEDFGLSRKSTWTLMTAEQPEGIKRRRKACNRILVEQQEWKHKNNKVIKTRKRVEGKGMKRNAQ